MHFWRHVSSSPCQVSAEIYARFGSKIYPAHSKKELLLGRCENLPWMLSGTADGILAIYIIGL